MATRVLILSPYPELIEETVTASGCDAITRLPNMEVSDWPETDWVISFGYRKIIQPHTIAEYGGRIINIHGSLLPYNRGAHPNFWSWWLKTPKGVTIHEVNDAIDGGKILARCLVADRDFRYPETLLSTYNDLLVTASGLFKRTWRRILANDIDLPARYDVQGSYHRAKDIDPFFKYLSRGWNSPVTEVTALGDLYRGINGKA